MTTPTRTLRLGGRQLELVLPNRKDARLHTSAAIVTVHVIGITALGFAVSVPQIVISILTAVALDAVFMLRSTGKLVWPASGVLTGSGVALILRVAGMERGDIWSFDGWYWFALVSGGSLLSKHLIRYRRQHLFNPSNLGLVAAFLLIGERFVEPLDFWWAPMGIWMLAAYAVIVGAGIAITGRLGLLPMVAAFWIFLAAGIGVLAASGHCMTATWSPTPICDQRFWTVVMTSPEVMIFAFFMITDPKTIPSGRNARIAFAASLAIASTLLIAPQALEYGAKVALLGSLVLWSPLRWVFDRLLAVRTHVSEPTAQSSRAIVVRRRGFVRGMAIGSGSVLLVVAIVGAGAQARDLAGFDVAEEVIPVVVDASELPVVSIPVSTDGLDLTIDEDFAAEMALMLAENLALESEAIRLANGTLLGLADAGNRLDDMQGRLATAVATGERVAQLYSFEDLTLGVHESEGQVSAGLEFRGRGTVDRIVYDSSGEELSRSTRTFDAVFVLRQLAGQRWLIVEVRQEPT